MPALAFKQRERISGLMLSDWRRRSLVFDTEPEEANEHELARNRRESTPISDPESPPAE
jgi:hypothetical protein